MTWDIFVGTCLGVPGLASADRGVCWDMVCGLLLLARESPRVGGSWICVGCRAMIGRRACLYVGAVRVSHLGWWLRASGVGGAPSHSRGLSRG